jgi:hypothetical protein
MTEVIAALASLSEESDSSVKQRVAVYLLNHALSGLSDISLDSWNLICSNLPESFKVAVHHFSKIKQLKPEIILLLTPHLTINLQQAIEIAEILTLGCHFADSVKFLHSVYAVSDSNLFSGIKLHKLLIDKFLLKAVGEDETIRLFMELVFNKEAIMEFRSALLSIEQKLDNEESNKKKRKTQDSMLLAPFKEKFMEISDPKLKFLICQTSLDIYNILGDGNSMILFFSYLLDLLPDTDQKIQIWYRLANIGGYRPREFPKHSEIFNFFLANSIQLNQGGLLKLILDIDPSQATWNIIHPLVKKCESIEIAMLYSYLLEKNNQKLLCACVECLEPSKNSEILSYCKLTSEISYKNVDLVAEFLFKLGFYDAVIKLIGLISVFHQDEIEKHLNYFESLIGSNRLSSENLVDLFQFILKHRLIAEDKVKQLSDGYLVGETSDIMAIKFLISPVDFNALSAALKHKQGIKIICYSPGNIRAALNCLKSETSDLLTESAEYKRILKFLAKNSPNFPKETLPEPLLSDLSPDRLEASEPVQSDLSFEDMLSHLVKIYSQGVTEYQIAIESVDSMKIDYRKFLDFLIEFPDSSKSTLFAVSVVLAKLRKSLSKNTVWKVFDRFQGKQDFYGEEYSEFLTNLLKSCREPPVSPNIYESVLEYSLRGGESIGKLVEAALFGDWWLSREELLLKVVRANLGFTNSWCKIVSAISERCSKSLTELICLETVSTFPRENEEILMRHGIFVLFSKMENLRRLIILAEPKHKETIKSMIDLYETRFKFKGKI